MDNDEAIKKMGKESFHGIIENYFNAEVEIGNFTSIASVLSVHGATEHPVFTSTYPFADKFHMTLEDGTTKDLDYPKMFSRGKIIIGNDVWIGAHVTILSGVTIGDGAIIGAHSVIAKDVEPYAVMVGNPAILKRKRFDEEIQKLLQIKWWDWPMEKILENVVLMKDTKGFIEKHG